MARWALLAGGPISPNVLSTITRSTLSEFRKAFIRSGTARPPARSKLDCASRADGDVVLVSAAVQPAMRSWVIAGSAIVFDFSGATAFASVFFGPALVLFEFFA